MRNWIIGWSLGALLAFICPAVAGDSHGTDAPPIILAQNIDGAKKAATPLKPNTKPLPVQSPKSSIQRSNDTAVKVRPSKSLKPPRKAATRAIRSPVIVAPKVTPKRPTVIKRAMRRPPPIPPAASGTVNTSKAQVAQMQRSLTALGFPAGAPDGISGKKTRAAVMTYQAAIGLPRSGALTQPQRDVLFDAARMLPSTSRTAALAYASRRTPAARGYGGVTAAMVRPAASPARPTRKFAGPGQFPPQAYRGYGILAFEATVSDFDRERHQMICQAYVTAMRNTLAVSTPTQDQFVTVWPLDSDALANKLNNTSVNALCDDAIDNYGIARAEEALDAASKVGFTDDGVGPYLLGWLPAESYNSDDALILVLDLSHVTNIQQARAMLSEWKQDIQSDPDLLKSGFSLEALRRKIRRFADKYGEGFLSLIS